MPERVGLPASPALYQWRKSLHELPAADFKHNPSHRIDAYLSIRTSGFSATSFQNCAQVRSDQVVDRRTVSKSKSRLRNHTLMSRNSARDRPRQTFKSFICSSLINAPHGRDKWRTLQVRVLSEDLSLWQNPLSGSILNITSADPWVPVPTRPMRPQAKAPTPENAASMAAISCFGFKAHS